MSRRRFPLIYALNTWTWLSCLSTDPNQRRTLADVPDSALDDLTRWGFDAIWLIGVWERSPTGRIIARSLPGLQNEYLHALPNYTAEDVVGSPFAIHRYEVDPVLGGRDGLAAFRKKLAARGIKLILDYVPNHVAVDHPWTTDRLDVMLTGMPEMMAEYPENYYRTENGAIIAHGRDPYFPPWTDTAQINAFAPAARAAAIETLIDLAGQCDGVRCDMAMLLLNRIFSHTWPHTAESAPDSEFWAEVIRTVRSNFPDFIFMAEAYWDTEAELHMLGFDAAYDKRLYDWLLHKETAEVRDHLLAATGYQARMVRFIENHDEQRAVTAFGVERSRAAAFLIAFLPGYRLFHDGQMTGARIKLPVQLGRRPIEPIDPAMQSFYKILLNEASQSIYHDGICMALALNPIFGTDGGHNALIAFAWAFDNMWRIGVVNLSGSTASARLMLPIPALRGQWRILHDVFSPETAEADGDDMLTAGLPITMSPYGYSLMELTV